MIGRPGVVASASGPPEATGRARSGVRRDRRPDAIADEVDHEWVGAEPGSAYVRYKWRSAAQFVMEALAGPPFRPEGREPLVMRWEDEDPERELARHAHSVALRACEEAKRRRDEDSSLAVDGTLGRLSDEEAPVGLHFGLQVRLGGEIAFHRFVVVARIELKVVLRDRQHRY